MKIDGKHYCDWCCVEFDERGGRMHSGQLLDKDGFHFDWKWAVHALFGVLICHDCDKGIKRRSPSAMPRQSPNRTSGALKYARRVESGKEKPPWAFARIRNSNGNNMCVPQKVKS